jgi:hypothetical protein
MKQSIYIYTMTKNILCSIQLYIIINYVCLLFLFVRHNNIVTYFIIISTSLFEGEKNCIIKVDVRIYQHVYYFIKNHKIVKYFCYGISI